MSVRGWYPHPFVKIGSRDPVEILTETSNTIILWSCCLFHLNLDLLWLDFTQSCARTWRTKMIVQIWEEYEGNFLQLVWVSWVSDGLCSEWNAWGFPVWMWEPQLMVTSLLNFVDLQNFKAKMEVDLWLPPVFWQARTLLKVTIILLFLSFLERPFNPHSENKEQSFQLNTFSTVRNSPHACGFVSYFVGHKWENNCRPVAGTRWTAFLCGSEVHHPSSCHLAQLWWVWMQRDSGNGFQLLSTRSHIFLLHEACESCVDIVLEG